MLPSAAQAVQYSTELDMKWNGNLYTLARLERAYKSVQEINIKWLLVNRYRIGECWGLICQPGDIIIDRLITCSYHLHI